MKSKILTNRGTQVTELEVGLPNWAGELFREYQAQRIASLPPTTILSMKRGTSTMKVLEYPKSDRKYPSGWIISTARGTAIRRL